MRKSMIFTTEDVYHINQVVEEASNYVRTNGIKYYTQVSQGFEILIMLNSGEIRYNKSEIFKLAHRGGLKLAWAIAREFKKLFTYTSNYVSLLHKEQDKHTQLLFTKSLSCNHPETSLIKHINAYSRFKSATDSSERDRAFICSMMYVKYFLESHTRCEVLELLDSFINTTKLSKFEYETEIKFIRKELNYDTEILRSRAIN